jgi:hypothetical protein
MYVDPARHLDPDACVDLLAGLVRGERQRDLLLHAATCPRCEDLFRLYGARVERARSASARWLAPVQGHAAVDAAEHERPAPRSTRSVPRRSTLRRWFGGRWTGAWVAAASVAALATAVLVPVVAHRGAARRLHWLPASTAEVTTRDPSSSLPDSQIRHGLEAYARHDLAGARRWLGDVESQGPIELVRRVYLANTLAQQGDHREAAAMLERLPTDLVPEPWRSESRWTLSVAWRESGQPARADSLLAVLATEPGPVGDRARSATERR